MNLFFAAYAAKTIIHQNPTQMRIIKNMRKRRFLCSDRGSVVPSERKREGIFTASSFHHLQYVHPIKQATKPFEEK